MTDGVFVPPGRQTFTDPLTGELLAFGKVYHYIPSTGTPKDTWTDEGLTTLNQNPIILDAGGSCTIWGVGLYRQILTRADDTQIWDEVTGFVQTGGGSGVTFATVAQVAALLSTDTVISPYTLGASGVLGGGGGGGAFYPKFTDLGGVGNGDPSNPAAGTDNAAAFATAVANASSRIWMNDGTFRTTGGIALQKYFDGSGKIYNSPSGEVMPGRYTYLSTAPTQFPVQGVGGWFAGQTDFIEPEYFIIGAACRHSVTDRYFEATTIPHNRWFTSFGGSSGCIAHVVSGGTIGSTSVVVDSVSGFTIGDTIGFTSTFASLTIADHVVISNITGGNTLVFSPALANAYSAGAYVALAPRVNNPFSYVLGRNYAAGDFYGDIVRVQQNYVPLAGQTHFFETSTVGQYGGDVVFTQSGNYATGWESQYIDSGKDVAVIAQVDTFLRTNDTGARSCVWMGTYFKSEGSVPADACYVTSGKWRTALDTVRADLTTFLTASDGVNAAINTALGHRWVMNSTATNGGRGGSVTYGPFYGNTPGDMYIESGTDGTSDYIAMRFNRAAPNDGRLRVRPTFMSTNKDFQIAGQITGGYDLQLGLVGSNPRVIFGTGGVWIVWDGANLKATKNSGGSYVTIV